jgi:hypothetical protein
MTKALNRFAIVGTAFKTLSAFQCMPLCLSLAALATFASPSAGAQNAANPEAATRNEDPHSVVVSGCLAKTATGEFFLLSDTDDLPRPSFQIIAPTSVLRRYANEWDTVRVVGVPSGNGDSATMRTKNIRLVHRQISRGPDLGRRSGWRAYSNADYGLSIKYPASFQAPSDPTDQQITTNFVNSDSAKTLLVLPIPREVYPNTTFAGGSVSVSVSDDIPNALTCSVFAETWSGSPGPRTVNGIGYSEGIIGGAGLGTNYSSYFFHTFHNGLCYEVAVALAVGNDRSYDLGCDLDHVDEEALMNPILSGLSFSKPDVELKPSVNNVSAPTVASFEATTTPSYIIPETKISWSVSGADYVRLSFKCDPNIGTAEREVECDSVPASSYAYTGEGSVIAHFQNRNQGPAPVVVKLQPFLNGVGDAAWSKTISVAIPPLK